MDLIILNDGLYSLVPVTKSPLDLYTQCGFLNENLLGFGSYYTFRIDMQL